MPEVFIVVQSGVYLHDLYGAYSSFELAVDVARRLAAADEDNYHNYDVCALPLDDASVTTDNADVRKSFRKANANA